MKAPATERAVQTTPPMIRAAVIPAVPLRPTATMTRDARIRVMRVIPLTGFDPTMAIALAATVVNRNAMIPTISTPTTACQMLSTTPRAKNPNTTRRVMTMPMTTIFIDMSLWVLMTSASAPVFFLLNSLAARPTADLMTPNDFTMPTIPAVAMPPMPIWRAYSLNICSGDICPMVWVIPEFIRSITSPPQMRFITGMITSHTRKLPQQMMKAYLSPTIYPSPSTAAPVFTLRRTFALSAIAAPHGRIFVVRVSPQSPNVDTMKSYRPPMSPLIRRVFAPLPPPSPLTSTWVVAVASGNGYFPCCSFTKYFLKGIRKRIPRIPPRSDEKNTFVKFTVSSGYLS